MTGEDRLYGGSSSNHQSHTFYLGGEYDNSNYYIYAKADTDNSVASLNKFYITIKLGSVTYDGDYVSFDINTNSPQKSISVYLTDSSQSGLKYYVSIRTIDQ